MRKTLLFVVIQLLAIGLIAQTQIYNPNADAKSEIENAVKQAKKENKHVLVQVGGNWCPWCVKLHNYFFAESTSFLKHTDFCAFSSIYDISRINRFVISG